MEFGLKITLCLLLATAAVTIQGSDPAHGDNDPRPAPAGNRPKRWAGFSGFDKGAAAAKPTKAPREDGFGFNLEDALRPAVKPTEKPSEGNCQGNMVQKLDQVLAQENQQLRLLTLLLADSQSRRYQPRRMR